MKITEVLSSQSICLFKPSDQRHPGDNVKALRLLRGCQERYGFFQGPQQLADFNLSAGITFLNGQFERKATIDKFQIFQNGLLAEGKVLTDALDAFLDDAILWAREETGLAPDDVGVIERSYLSQIEVQSSVSIGSALDQFVAFGRELGETIRSYGQNTPDFQVSALWLNGDLTDTPLPKPGAAFIFDRRVGKRYESGLYFSSAPLRSADHLRFLERLERLLSVKKTSGS